MNYIIIRKNKYLKEEQEGWINEYKDNKWIKVGLKGWNDEWININDWLIN